MSDSDSAVPSPSVGLMVPAFILFVFLSFAVIRGPALISSSGIGSAVIVVAPLVLATYALTAIVMAGRAGVDLSIGPLIGFINVGLIKLVEFGVLASPIAVFAYVIAVGVVYQLAMGLIIVYVRVQPIIVSLSGYLALAGLNLIILPRPGGVAPDWMMDWGSGTSIFSPVLAIVVVATVAWYLLAQTAFFGHLRLMGSDERAAYTSGVKITLVRLGAHVVAGVFAGLAAICFTSLISSGDPTQGTTLTLMSVTALVLGGANLAGGRGGAIGSLLGALNIYLITYLLATFNFGTLQSYVTDLSYGTMLVASLLISSAAPRLQVWTRHLSPAVFFSILACLGAGVIAHATFDAHGRYLTAATVAPAPAATVAAHAATTSQGGGALTLVVIGLVGFAYLIRTLLRYPRPPMIGFCVLVVAVALGLLFHGSGAGLAPAVGRAAPDYGLDILTFGANAETTGPDLRLGLASRLSVALLLVLGVVLLSSMLIWLNLVDRKHPIGREWRSSFLPLLALAPLALIAVFGVSDAGAGSVFGGAGLTFVAVGAALFVLMRSPLTTGLRDVSSLYIGALGLIAFGALYFSPLPPPGAPHPQMVESVLTPQKALSPPAFATDPTAKAVATAVHRRSLMREVAFTLLTGFGLQLALWLAMRRRATLRAAAAFVPVIAIAATGWAAMFANAGAPLINTLVVLVGALVSAPLVWRALAAFALSIERPGGIADLPAGSRNAVRLR